MLLAPASAHSTLSSPANCLLHNFLFALLYVLMVIPMKFSFAEMRILWLFPFYVESWWIFYFERFSSAPTDARQMDPDLFIFLLKEIIYLCKHQKSQCLCKMHGESKAKRKTFCVRCTLYIAQHLFGSVLLILD